MGKDPDKPALQPSDFFASLADLESGPDAMSDEQILGMCQLIAADKGRAR